MLYASDSPAGAIGEAFGNHAVWTPHLLAGPPSLPGSRRALASYRLRGPFLDLDDPAALLQRRLRPSQIVVRDLEVTQAWAARVFEEGRWDGVRWWSRHDARWGAYGLWSLARVEPLGVEPLAAQSRALQEARLALNRPWRAV